MHCVRETASTSVRRRIGFTLIDLTITVLIMGILASAAVPRFSDVLNSTRANCAAQRIAADLRYLRSQAIASSTAIRVDFSTSLNRYTLIGVKSVDRPTVDYSVDLVDLFRSTLTSASLGGDPSLQFDIHGQPDSGGTITVKCGSTTKTITLRAVTGEASIN